MPPDSLPWLTPFMCAGASTLVSGFPTLMSAIRLLPSWWFRSDLQAHKNSCLSRYRLGALLQILEEPVYLLPYLPPSAEAPPVHPDKTDQAVALVHRDEEVLSGPPDPVYEERLNVTFHPLQHRVLGFEFLPGIQLQERLGRSHGARIECHDPLCRRAVEEDSHVDRDSQALPLRVLHLEVFEEQVAVWYEPVAALARRLPIEEDRTRPADAHDLTRGDLQQMPVLRPYRLATQLAELLGSLFLCGLLPGRCLRGPLGLLPGEPAQSGESRGGLSVTLIHDLPQPTALGRAIFTLPSSPTSSGMGSRCSPSSSRHLPARRTSSRRPHRGQPRSATSRMPPSKDSPQPG